MVIFHSALPLRYSEMPDNIRSLLQDIFLIILLIRIIMMNHIWYTFHIPSVRNYPDMILEHYNVAALPLFNVIYIRGQTGRCMFKIYSQVLYSSEINIFIRLIDIIILRILSDIFVYQFPQVISALLKRISDNICTDTISVIRITSLIISALVNRPLLHINQCIL